MLVLPGCLAFGTELLHGSGEEVADPFFVKELFGGHAGWEGKRLQFAFGAGRYEVPSFLLSGDANYDVARWEATVTSIQVARVTYRFRGAMKSGPAVGAVLLNQNYRLRSERLGGETRFRPLSVGVTAGYYAHVGRHFYLYPTAAYTYNRVISGSTTIRGTSYDVERWSPNASLHAGWEWGR